MESNEWLLGRFQAPVTRKRTLTPRKALATVALMVTAAVALAGSIVATYYALPLLNEFSDGCQKLSDRDVVRVLGAGTTVDRFDYDGPGSYSALGKSVLADGDLCTRDISGWGDGDRGGSRMLFTRTYSANDAAAVFRLERDKARARDAQETQALRTFFLNDIRFGDEAFCTVTKSPRNPAHGVVVRFGDKVVYAEVPSVSTRTDGENCERARRLANELR
ncbi:hypothetical protein [Nocardia sp. NPDC056100]|uniref:hypothetical protein n=1 Tax=Nocardia sp. NPDC056100 TaxID=3345712 RepID=UPI0035DA7588